MPANETFRLARVVPKLADMTLAALKSDVLESAGKRAVEVQLHWSEYLQGEWSTRESGGFSPLIVKPVPASFRASGVFIHVSKENSADGAELGVFIHLGGDINQAFYLAGRNSAPEKADYGAPSATPPGPMPERIFSASTPRAARYSGSGALKVSFKERITTEPGKTPCPANPSILQQGGSYTLLPCNNNLADLGVSEEAYRGAARPDAVKAAIESGLGEIASLIKPVFYQDNRHTFFVEPDVAERTIEEWQEWITRTPQPDRGWLDPDRWKDLVVIPEIPRKGPLPDPWQLTFDSGSLINPIRDRDWLVNPTTAIRFDDVLIGPTGQPGIEISTGVSAPTEHGDVSVNPGSDLAGGSTVLLRDENTFAKSGLKVIGGGLNIVGGTGFNSAMEKNFSDLNRSGFGAGAPGAGRLGR